MNKRITYLIYFIIFIIFIISFIAIYKVKKIDTNHYSDTTTVYINNTDTTSDINTNIENDTNNTTSSTSNNTSTSISNDSNTTSKNISSTNSKNTNNTTKIDTNTTIETTTAKDENNELRKQLESTYGITIKYGDEMSWYKPKGYSPNILTDNTKINTFLKDLQRELGKYPTNFFRSFGDMGLTIYLIDSMPNNEFNGLTDKEYPVDVKITYVYGYEFTYTFHHELMHYIDLYLDIKHYGSDHYSTFTSFNPEGFTYGNINSNYSYNYNGQGAGNNIYFFNDYSQGDVREDRAELFKFMMGRSYPYGQLLNSNYPTGKKARAIVNELLNEFPSFSTINPNWNKVLN